MENRAARTIAWLAIIAVLSVGVVNTIQAIGDVQLIFRFTTTHSGPSVLSGADPSWDSALHVTPTFHQTASASHFTNPFRVAGDAAAVRRTISTAATYQRTPLTLKGVLLKSKPLVILEDDRATTHIRGVGDRVHGQEIVSISRDRVRLRDAAGTYELSVKER